MIQSALNEGKIDSKTVIVEATSGNTGIALAMICADLGLQFVATMPESMSIERRKMITLFGAQLELTPASLGMKGAVDKANEILKIPQILLCHRSLTIWPIKMHTAKLLP